MKKALFIIVLIGFYMCKIQKKMTNEFLTFKGGEKYVFVTPEGYISEKRYESENKYAQDYLFSDSSLFYITTFSNTNNYEEIRRQDSYADRFSAFHSGDTITLNGVDKQGLYWKDRLIKNGVTIGYSKVSSKNKDDFDKAIFSIRKND